ncbi:MAG: hypothetical protein CVU98_05805 [Firmicutes bacterium HGW-Firmicutes-3]|jgi:undecaprenyl-phosphate 4-deoxy-4-formamido-L-arabinose transferase|nr:MAG: hypothetical protein CVU98_05805 [Firmicutes bacterium HGW-Firmicutes-3]
MISIVIPTYNRAAHLERLFWQVDKAMKQMGEYYELIIVDDASKDTTSLVIRKLCKINHCIKGIILSDNVGQQNATLAGIRHAAGEIVVTLDDDLKYDPATIKQLLEVYRQGYDVVYGKVVKEKRRGFRSLGTAFKESLLFLLCKKPKDVQLTSYKVMGGPVLAHICEDNHEKVYLSARLLQKTQNIINVKIADNNENLESTYSWCQLVEITYNILKYYGPKPFNNRIKNKRAQYHIKEFIQ